MDLIAPVVHANGTARRILGPCEVTAVLANEVLQVRDGCGQEFVVKQHASQPKHQRKVHAYRHWTAALGSSAPTLIAADSTARTIVITSLPGQPCSGELTAAVHHQAGTLLRRFHDAEPARELCWFPGWLDDRLRHWTSQAKTLLSTQDATVIDSHLAALRTIGVPYGTPCHLDFQPRNWIVGESRNLALVDFEHARTDLPARDLVRLHFRIWPSRPDLQDAFFDGYGHHLTDAEAELVWHLGALDALTALARGHQLGDPMLTASGHATLRQLRRRPLRDPDAADD
jgi:Ser/Thr protein kinase RdoA (MazF antagonist)